jgi:ATP-dependent RNA helicase RhlE
MTQSTFEELNLAPKLLEILRRHQFTVPTPIQHKSIPVAIEGKDIIGIAQTGTGKTLAFGLPMIQRLAELKGQGLVLVPTRELALQVEQTLQKIGSPLNVRTAVLIGGEPIARQIRSLARRPHILVATPGRLLDHLQQKSVNLNEVKILVLDEADRMFDMGFAVQLNQILKQVPKARQTLLFSATMPPAIVQIATQHMALPLRVEVAPAGTTIELVEQELFILPQQSKLGLLENLLQQYKGSILIFLRTKHATKKVTATIRALGHNSAEIHSNRSLNQRREALEGFRSGKYRILVATDIAARGIDVTGIEVVINFDLPDVAEDCLLFFVILKKYKRVGESVQRDKV